MNKIEQLPTLDLSIDELMPLSSQQLADMIDVVVEILAGRIPINHMTVSSAPEEEAFASLLRRECDDKGWVERIIKAFNRLRLDWRNTIYYDAELMLELIDWLRERVEARRDVESAVKYAREAPARIDPRAVVKVEVS